METVCGLGSPNASYSGYVIEHPIDLHGEGERRLLALHFLAKDCRDDTEGAVDRLTEYVSQNPGDLWSLLVAAYDAAKYCRYASGFLLGALTTVDEPAEWDTKRLERLWDDIRVFIGRSPDAETRGIGFRRRIAREGDEFAWPD